MFDLSIDERLSTWAAFRQHLETAEQPFDDVWNFWKDAPFIPYNNAVDPYFQFGWPTPWDIIVHNKYDDFTKALMIGWTLKLTKRFEKCRIEIKTLVDKSSLISYNIICVDNRWAINYKDNGPTLTENIPTLLNLENIIELNSVR